MFLLLQFMTGNAKQDLTHRIKNGSGFDEGKDENDQDSVDGKLRCYEKTINYLLQTYTDIGMIDATEAAISTLTQREKNSPMAFKEVIFQ